MKKYILQTLALLFLLVLILFTLNLVLDKRMTIKKYCTLTDEKPYIILGSSQAACAFNDSFLTSFVNLSTPMEGYFYTYFKSKKILEFNPQIKAVFLEFNNTQISGWSDNRVWGLYMPYLLPRYTSVVDWKGMLFLFSKNPVKVIQAWHGSLLRKIAFIADGNRNLIQEELREHVAYTEHFYTMAEIVKMQEKKPTVVNPSNDISETSMIYLDKVNRLCIENHIKLYLIRVPYPPYMETDNEPALQNLLATRFKGLEFLDFRGYPLTNEYYADLDPHLNSIGAKKFSAFFDQLIADGLLENSHKEEIINRAIVVEKMKMLN